MITRSGLMPFFRLIAGSHVGMGPKGCQCDRCQFDRDAIKQGVPPKGHIYERGDIIESKSDLCLHFNAPRAIKFERVDPSGRPVHDAAPNVQPAVNPSSRLADQDNLDNMTVEELRAFAAEEEIDLDNAVRKQDIIQAIRASIAVV